MGYTQVIRQEPPLPAYISLPETGGKHPVVILFMHRPGLDESQKLVCDDLAKAGYVAIGHDAYRDGKLDAESYTDETIFTDFEYTLQYAKEMKQVDEERIGVIGFCMGGRHAYIAAARYSELTSIVSYYGFPTRGNDTTDTPINLVPEYNAPVLGIFGEDDHLIPLENVERFKEVLLASSDKHDLLVCSGVGHGFLNPHSKNHKEEAAASAWMQTLEHLRKYI